MSSPNFALRRTMPAVWAHVGVMQIDIGRRDVHFVTEFGALIDSMPSHGRPVVCIVNGEYIPRCDWWQPARPGDVILWQEVAGGGGSNPLKLILTIAILVVAPEIAPYLTGEFGVLAGVNTALVTAGLIVAGNLLVNAILPGPGVPGAFGVPEASPTYSVALQSNSARLGSPIPVQYGQENCTPDYGSQPYAEYSASNDQFFCANLIVGMGVHEILAITIDDTDLRNFADVTCVRVGPSQDVIAGPYVGALTFTAARAFGTDDRMVSSLEVAGQEFKDGNWSSALTLNRAGTRIVRVFFDVACPRGLGTVNNDGSMTTYGVTWQMALRAINDAGQAIGGWTIIATANLTEATTSAVRRSYAYDVPAGRYQARMRRVTERIDNGRTLNDFQWIGLRGLLSVDGIQRTDVTGLSIRIRANEQLSGLSQRRIRVLSRRRVPVYDADTETWSDPVFTRNPAWALADVWRNTTYGRGLPESRIDLDGLVELADTWDARQDRFDYRFETKLSTDAAAQLVARSGRAKTILRRGAIYSTVRDELQTAPVAAYMPRNMDRDSFALDFVLPTEQTTDTVEANYRDGQVWDERKVYGQIYDGELYVYPYGERPAGVPAPTNVEAVTLPGIVGRTHALRETMALIAAGYYLRESAGWTADLDALLPTFGSLVATAHDVAQWGQSGDVVSWTPGTMTLELTEPVAFGTGDHYVRLVDHVGVPGPAILATAGASEREIVLAAMPSFTPSTNDADRERTRYLFGALADVQRYAVVKAIRPQSEDSVAMAVVMEDNRRHTADEYLLPAEGEIQDPLSDGSFVGSSDGGGGGGGLPVALQDFTLRKVPLFMGGEDPIHIIFNSDGYVGAETTALDTPSSYPGTPGDNFAASGITYQRATDMWLPSHPVASVFADEYELRAELVEIVISGPPNPDFEPGPLTGTFDTWLPLGTPRVFSYARGTGPNNSSSFARIRFRIRDAATQVEQGSCVASILHG